MERIIKVVALQGSARPNSFTSKALAVVKEYLLERSDVELHIVDPSSLALQLPGQGESEGATHMQALVRAADAVLLATPEYHGSYSSVMKLMIDNMGFPSALKGKPVSLLGVASGRIGAIKALEHLRSVASHVGAMVLPGPVSIAGVRSKFDETGQLTDKRTEKMIHDLVDNLIEYAISRICPNKALEAFVRESQAN